jgi:hypothetical protein
MITSLVSDWTWECPAMILGGFMFLWCRAQHGMLSAGTKRKENLWSSSVPSVCKSPC